jgi:hypothetical protein
LPEAERIMPQFLSQPIILMQAINPLITKQVNLEHISNPSIPNCKDLKPAKDLLVFSSEVLWYGASCDCSAVLEV